MFKEYFLTVTNNSSTLQLAQHLLEHGHFFDKMENIKQILHLHKKNIYVFSKKFFTFIEKS